MFQLNYQILQLFDKTQKDKNFSEGRRKEWRRQTNGWIKMFYTLTELERAARKWCGLSDSLTQFFHLHYNTCQSVCQQCQSRRTECVNREKRIWIKRETRGHWNPSKWMKRKQVQVKAPVKMRNLPLEAKHELIQSRFYSMPQETSIMTHTHTHTHMHVPLSVFLSVSHLKRIIKFCGFNESSADT